MFPAARIGDPITHDMVVPCGVIGPPTGPMPTVFIEGMPAAYVSCTCNCTGAIASGAVHPPMPPTGPPPPIVKGSTTVFICGMPAARWAPSGDMAACGVFLGNPALTATRTTFIGG